MVARHPPKIFFLAALNLKKKKKYIIRPKKSEKWPFLGSTLLTYWPVCYTTTTYPLPITTQYPVPTPQYPPVPNTTQYPVQPSAKSLGQSQSPPSISQYPVPPSFNYF